MNVVSYSLVSRIQEPPLEHLDRGRSSQRHQAVVCGYVLYGGVGAYREAANFLPGDLYQILRLVWFSCHSLAG